MFKQFTSISKDNIRIIELWGLHQFETMLVDYPLTYSANRIFFYKHFMPLTYILREELQHIYEQPAEGGYGWAAREGCGSALDMVLVNVGITAQAGGEVGAESPTAWRRLVRRHAGTPKEKK